MPSLARYSFSLNFQMYKYFNNLRYLKSAKVLENILKADQPALHLLNVYLISCSNPPPHPGVFLLQVSWASGAFISSKQSLPSLSPSNCTPDCMGQFGSFILTQLQLLTATMGCRHKCGVLGIREKKKKAELNLSKRKTFIILAVYMKEYEEHSVRCGVRDAVWATCTEGGKLICCFWVHNKHFILCFIHIKYTENKSTCKFVINVVCINYDYIS